MTKIVCLFLIEVRVGKKVLKVERCESKTEQQTFHTRSQLSRSGQKTKARSN